MSEWQPIETAPRDLWLLLFSQYDGCHVACWDKFWGGWRGLETDHYGDPVLLDCVTHWMSLPENPK